MWQLRFLSIALRATLMEARYTSQNLSNDLWLIVCLICLRPYTMDNCKYFQTTFYLRMESSALLGVD
jgi:hypothetical protein